jgi:hypothetical protein
VQASSTVFSSRLSHSELRSSLRESHSFLSLPADTTMASSQGTPPHHPFLAIHSVDEHRMIYSCSNTSSYSTFYAFLSTFRITLWPMCVANNKRQSFFIHHSHTHKNTHRTDQKTDKHDGKPVLCQRTFSSVFHAFFFYIVNLLKPSGFFTYHQV